MYYLPSRSFLRVVYLPWRSSLSRRKSGGLFFLGTFCPVLHPCMRKETIRCENTNSIHVSKEFYLQVSSHRLNSSGSILQDLQPGIPSCFFLCCSSMSENYFEDVFIAVVWFAGHFLLRASLRAEVPWIVIAWCRSRFASQFLGLETRKE